MNIVTTDSNNNVIVNRNIDKAVPPMKIEYIHPDDGEFMSIYHHMNSAEGTSKILGLIKWAAFKGVELRIRTII